MGIKPRPFRRLEKIDNVALISVVGEGLSTRPGIAAKCFAATAGCNVNVEMIAFGPSRVALYFVVQGEHLRKAVAAIHSSFFSSPRCQ
jgi:aspartate kinase